MFRRTSTQRIAAAAGLAVGLLVGADSRGEDRSSISAPLEVAGSDTDATGSLRFEIKSGRVTKRRRTSAQALLQVGVANLDPDTDYLLRTNGVDRAVLRTDQSGKGSLSLPVLPTDGTTPALDVDPRGTLVSVSDGGQDLLAAVLYGPLEPAATSFDETTELAPGSAPADASASARCFLSGSPLRRVLEISAKGVPAGSYSVRVDGVRRGSFDVAASGKKKKLKRGTTLSIDAEAFDPRYELVEIVGGSNVVFSGPMLATIPGGGSGGGGGQTKRVAFTMRIPDYATSQVAGFTLWRLDQNGVKWNEAERVFLWPLRRGKQGREFVDYSYTDPVTGRVRNARFTASVAHTTGADLVMQFVYDRPGAPAYFKVSTFNQVGESPRSANALMR